MSCKDCVAADTGDKWYESLQSTHSYCKMEKNKINSPKAVFWKLRFYFPDEVGQSRDLPSYCGGKRKPGENAGAVGSRGLCATSALPSNITRHDSYSTWEHLWEWQELC